MNTGLPGPSVQLSLPPFMSLKNLHIPAGFFCASWQKKAASDDTAQ